MKYLIVDDSKRFRIFIKDFILKESDDCIELDDGLHVVITYESYQPDWVLMDIKMKALNGLEATKNLIMKFPKAKVVLVSNHCDLLFREKAKEYGALALVGKENLFELDEILNKHFN